jgi:hypothetical protein
LQAAWKASSRLSYREARPVGRAFGVESREPNASRPTFFPQGTPAAIVQKNAATVKPMETPSGATAPEGHRCNRRRNKRRSPVYLQKFVESETEKWTIPIKASGLSMD